MSAAVTPSGKASPSRIGGEVLKSDGYKTESYKPPLINPYDVPTADQLMTRLPGEDLYSGMTPAQRAAQKLMRGLSHHLRQIAGGVNVHFVSHVLSSSLLQVDAEVAQRNLHVRSGGVGGQHQCVGEELAGEGHDAGLARRDIRSKGGERT